MRHRKCEKYNQELYIMYTYITRVDHSTLGNAYLPHKLLEENEASLFI